MAAAAPAPSCLNTEHGCVMFDCLTQLWDWFDPAAPQAHYQMESKKLVPATQQPLTQQHLMAHHVHPDHQIYAPQPPAQLTSPAPSTPMQPNGVMHQILQTHSHSQYHTHNTSNPRSPLLENRHEVYGTSHAHDYGRHYAANEHYNSYPQSPPRSDRDHHMDHTVNHTGNHAVNHDLLHNIPKGYNAEVYQDYLKRNPPKDTNQIYQNHQSMYRSNVNQYVSKPYLPYTSRLGVQSNTEILRRQYNEIQQMKLQQQMHYQNQAQMQQQQKFAERQLLQQQIHGIQPPPNLQNNLYSDGSYRDDRYGSRNDFKDYSTTDIPKDLEKYSKSNELKEQEKPRQYQEPQWQSNQATDFREADRYQKQFEGEKECQSPPAEFIANQKGVGSPMKSSESSSTSIKSPSSEGRRSSGGPQALRSPVAQRMPSAPVAMAGVLYKQGSDGLKVWRKRWFVLSEYCLFYYKTQEEEKLLGSVLLPSYRVSACSAEDNVHRKCAFKLEHANMRTYVLAAPDHEAMLKWVKGLTMAALMQSPGDPRQNLIARSGAAKPDENDEVPGPTYANAPPKPRRSNDGYNSPSPDMYDPNYDLLKKPASHYSQSPSHTRYPEQTSYPASPGQETYARSPQPPHPPPHQKRPYDTHQLSLPLTNTVTDRLENNQPQAIYRTNPQSPYFDNRNRGQQPQELKQDNQVKERVNSRNPFLQDISPAADVSLNDIELQNKTRTTSENDRANYESDTYAERMAAKASAEAYGREVYGELAAKANRAPVNERLMAERRTPDAYGRAASLAAYKPPVGDYEDVYAAYTADNDYGKTYPLSPNTGQQTPTHPQQSQQEYPANYPQEKTFSGPAVLRRKKMQASGMQPAMPRPHSADFLEYESREMLNRTMPARVVTDPPKQPQRPKSSLDINSYYDPSSDRYYSEESYAEKMRQSAIYMQQQQGMSPRNIQIPLAKYASGLAEKQLNSPYSQAANHNYETEFGGNRNSRANASYSSQFGDTEGLNANWTLREKEGADNKKEYLNRSGSVLSVGSTSGFVRESNRYDPAIDAFIRSASARLPSTITETTVGGKKVYRREESMKRLLEWKQRMLQSPLTRKSTPATILLARSLHQSRQSLRSDLYRLKAYNNATYNICYSSDDEEETSGTELQKPTDMQAGRSHKVNVTSPSTVRPVTPHATPAVSPAAAPAPAEPAVAAVATAAAEPDNTYENILCTINMPKISYVLDGCDYENTRPIKYPPAIECPKDTDEKDGYETHESEAESETQMEYTDNDLDEVLMESDHEQTDENAAPEPQDATETNKTTEVENKSETPPIRPPGEDHYLPMSPRKTSTIEPAHKTILQSLSVFNDTMPQGYEDNPYVEMNVGNEEEDMQTYEIVCVNNGKMEPVYMELSSIAKALDAEDASNKSIVIDTASNFADSKNHTLKRANKTDKSTKEKSDNSDADEESSKDNSMVAPYCRFSISDTFRPASYYLGTSKNSILDDNGSALLPPPVPTSPPPCDELSDDALSKYILDKLDKSDMSQDNSILKMLTTENQKMSTVKRKTTSLMIYGSRTSIHDTLSRGEKIRNSRASLNNDKKMSEQMPNYNNSILEQCNSSGIETDSLTSYNAEIGSRLSSESDISSKFEMTPSNVSSDVASLNESEMAIDFRYSGGSRDIEMMKKRRPLSDDSLFELNASQVSTHSDFQNSVDLDRYLDNLQPSTSNASSHHVDSQLNVSGIENSACKDNVMRAAHLQTSPHMRCSSTPVYQANISNVSDNKVIGGLQFRHSTEQEYMGSHSSCSSTGLTKSPISYYCKNYDEEITISKNLNNEVFADKIKGFENEKIVMKPANEANSSSITTTSTTGFHSRESSTEHSAPYYYSDLSSQEHINLLPTSHYLKNTNLHRKLNNQRRRGPLHKKTEISHIHNPIRSNQLLMSDRSFDLAASARSVSVEFLSAADKDPEIDVKNIYESTGGRNSKIPESMNLMPGLGSKRNAGNVSSSSPDSCVANQSGLNGISAVKMSNASMSSHCSGASSNTVYYDAEAEASAYENIMCQGEKHWDEDTLWRDNLRRVSHRHAKSMDDLDTVQTDTLTTGRASLDASGMNSIKRVKKPVGSKLSRNVTYVNCDIQNKVLRRRENSSLHVACPEEDEKGDDNDVYVSLAEDAGMPRAPADEGVYEQLAVESTENSLPMQSSDIRKYNTTERNRKRFEIDREKLRQWDLMSSGLMKGGMGRVRGAGAGGGAGGALGSVDAGTDSASNEASMSMGANLELGINMSKRSFAGSNTSLNGRSREREPVPMRAVSPRLRWGGDKTPDYAADYSPQHTSASHQNLNALTATEDSWAAARSPSRAQQPVRAVSPRVRPLNTEKDELARQAGGTGTGTQGTVAEADDVPTAGELLGSTHEELVLLLIKLRRRHAATHRAIEHCCAQITSVEDCMNSLKAMEREESLQRLEQLKHQLLDLENQYEKSKPLVLLVDNMVKLGSLYNRPGSTVERLERNQRLRQKVLAEHALEQERWLENAAAGREVETEAARTRVAELWSLEQELAEEAAILQGLKTDKDAIESLITGVRSKLKSVPHGDLDGPLMSPDMSPGVLDLSPETLGLSPAAASIPGALEAELARVHSMLAHNSKKLEKTVNDNARLEHELQHLRRALQARRANAPYAQHAQHAQHASHAPTALLEDVPQVSAAASLANAYAIIRSRIAIEPVPDPFLTPAEVTRVQQLVSALQRQRQELSSAVRQLTQQSHALQTTHDSMPGKRRPMSSWQETNLDTGHTTDHEGHGYEHGHYDMETPLYVDTRGAGDLSSPLNSEDLQHNGFVNLTNVEKQEIKTVRIVKRESERRQRDRERSLQPMSDWSSGVANIDQFLEDELMQPVNFARAASASRTDFSDFKEYYSKPSAPEPPNYLRLGDSNMELSPKFPSSPSLSSYDYSRDLSVSSGYRVYEKSPGGYDRSLSTQYLHSPSDSVRTLTNDISKAGSGASMTRSHAELSPVFKSEAAKQIVTEMAGDAPRNGSLHRRSVPREKRRHYTAPHHLSAKTLNEIPTETYAQDKLGRSLDDADMERALRTAPAPDVVRSALPTRYADSIDQLLAAPQKILIPERYIPEKPPELSPEEQQKRQEKVESIKKMLSSSSADPNKSPDGVEKRQREHLLQMNQILAKQVTEMSKIIAVKALEDLPQQDDSPGLDDRSPDIELPIFQQRDNYFT